MTVIQEDLLIEGPYFNQVRAGAVKVRPSGASATAQPVSLGKIAAAAGSSSRNANGLPTSGQFLALTDAKESTGIPLPAAAASGIFGISMTAGTSESLVSEVANGSTVTDTALFEFSLPQSYIPGSNFTIEAQAVASITTGASLTTETLVIHAYSVNQAGTHSADLAGGTITLTGTAAIVGDVVVTGTSLVAGSHLVATAVMKLVEANGTNAHGIIGSVNIH